MLQSLIWTSGLIVAGFAGWMDWRTRRIPNWLTVTALAAGLATHTLAAGWAGAKTSLAGAGLALALLLPFVLLRGLGGGDWKLMGALGAWLGPKDLLIVLIATVFINGAMALWQAGAAGSLGQALANTGELLGSLLTLRPRPHETISLDNPSATTVPFGVAAALAMLACFVMIRPWS